MNSKQLSTIGWREWLSLPELGVPNIKVKVDTGARSSAIHAINIEQFEAHGIKKVRFQVAPVQSDNERLVMVETTLLEERAITDSGGHQQVRPVIMTSVCLGELQWPIELTLTNRDVMGFRMLLGRQAVKDRFLVNPGQSYIQSQDISKEGSTDLTDLSNGDDFS
ncbi:ATP-dependent zinc protease [Leptolyngbya cf. ectocarpi LEGE 11479]|uniref:ATP-dependent zinc protease n=1 Tax=Leptolyngbya cf. ectocarpi LEGE 11479 TaxID=1828722 RepID=A0A929F9T1_LEPEC|nr:RimK/LysX family protein [Leptolyngbya ectocarpi]MBE9068032.1 ATP-dependent zinc protease [Leptolyngbya cf. ectocarpi LEGE 11479]